MCLKEAAMAQEGLGLNRACDDNISSVEKGRMHAGFLLVTWCVSVLRVSHGRAMDTDGYLE